MKKLIIPVVICFLFTLLSAALFSPASASPHRMFVAYKVGRIDIDVYFEDGTPARNAYVEVYQPDGTLYLEAKADDEGKLSFEPPEVIKGEWQVVAESVGHRAETTMNLEAGGETGEVPLYTRVIAGLGYLAGLAGAAVGYIGWRTQRRRSDRAS